MDARKAIAEAKDRLLNSRDLNAHLTRHKTVRVPVLGEVSPRASDYADAMPTDVVPGEYVTFTIEETGFGLRLMAEYQGNKEFAA